METLILLLMICTAPGYSYVLQPKAGVAQRNRQSELRNVDILAQERKRGGNMDNKAEQQEMSEGVSLEIKTERRPVMTVEERGEEAEHIRGRGGRNETLKSESAILREDMGEDLDTRREGLDLVWKSSRSPSRHLDTSKKLKRVKSDNSRQQEDETYDEMDVKFKKIDPVEKLRQEILEEERESKLVAGINLYETRGDTYEDEKIILAEEISEEGEDINNASQNEWIKRENEGHKRVPLSRTSSAQVETETKVAATKILIITHSQSPPLPISSVPPNSHASVRPQSFPPSPTVPTLVPGEMRSVSLLEGLLIEMLQPPGRRLKQNELESTAGPHLVDEVNQKIWLEPNTTHEAQGINTVVRPESTFAASVHTATPKPNVAQFILRELSSEGPNPTPKSNDIISTAQPVRFTHKPNMTQPIDKPNKLVEKDTNASPPRPQMTKPSERPRPTAAKAPSVRPMKINSSVKTSKEKKRKKASQRKEKVTTPTHFPYFMDNYCPPECACYGRVVQCSDKGVDKIPYGIPYNSRFILLMNNHIDSIQLDLLSQYVSMEFLALSNNRLTDGAIEWAFEGVPALKRLYLEKNLLESVPTDLPVSLEELRLDDNHLTVMSEAAWARCPGLLVLSLSNNSLGNESESLPNAVLSPLRNLRTLNLNHNQLMKVPLGLPLSIKELYLKGNRIEQFRGGAFVGLSELLVLDLSANRLTNKGLLRDSLLNATRLESLNLEGNRLKQVPRHLPSSLKTLNLKGNFISSIKKAAFNTMKNLEHLGLARNKISRVALGAFRTLPILHQLDLGHNILLQVPRQLPQCLHSVALMHNKIESVPRDAFCWGDKSPRPSRLVQVQLEHNLIDMEKLDAQAFRCLRGFQVVHFY